MRVASLSLLALLVQFTAQISAIPITNDQTSTSHSLLPQSEVCDNAPCAVAGTPSNRRTNRQTLLPRSSTLQARVISQARWNAARSATYVLIVHGYDIAGDSVPHMLTDAYNTVVRHIADVGDGLVPGGVWAYTDFGTRIAFQNTNNHQQTWGVLGAAMSALLDYTYYMKRTSLPAAITFRVFDGQHEVGFGWIQHI